MEKLQGRPSAMLRQQWLSSFSPMWLTPSHRVLQGVLPVTLSSTAAPQKSSHQCFKRNSHSCRAGVPREPSPGVTGSPSTDRLRRALSEAVAQEDYSRAASLKKELDVIAANDPVVQLRIELKAAISQERYKEAAALLAAIQQQEKLTGNSNSTAAISNSSDTVTGGVRVVVTSYFVPAQSEPRLSQYFFAYTVRVSNEGGQVVQLRERHWIITDSEGRVDEVRGAGVIGEQPILLPGKSFEYSSGAPLHTPHGTMEGEYTFALLDESDGEWKGSLEVRVGCFALTVDAPSTA